MSLELWNKISRPPKTALKTINGGRLSGMTDISPMWRYQMMTEVFGPCGEGWKYTIDRLWTEPVGDDQVIAFANVSVYTTVKSDNGGEGWSDPIPGNGGSMLIAKERNGLHSSDEAFKMAITDALGTALKMLGMAADIYMGNFDGTKYKDEKPVKFATKDDLAEVASAFKVAGITEKAAMLEYAAEFCKREIHAANELTSDEARSLVKELKGEKSA